MQGLMRLLMVPEVSKTMNLLSYGEPLTTGAGGIGGTTKVKPEVLDAAMAVAPMAPVAGRAARGAARMAGQEIADVMSGMPSRSLLGDITPKPMQLITYHGTPHKFPPTQKNLLGEFDASKIGTGEGAQSYGYGIYVAENPSVAKDYQLMERNWFDTSKAKYKGKSIDSWYEQAQKDQEKAFRTNNKALEKDASARLAYWENIMIHSHPETVLKQFTDPEFGWDEATKFAKSIDLKKFVGIPNTGTLYKVDLPDDKIAKMLDWDKPLSKQSPEVQSAIEKLTGIKVDKNLLNEYDDALLNALQGGSTDLPKQPIDPLGSDLMRMISKNDKKSAQKLRDQGVPGVKYFDAGSRDASEGTRNFVVFPGEEKSLKILERDGEKAPFQFPQQGALDTAQKNAALPISEGGLGLPPNNTPMDRAKAMGAEDVLHGTSSSIEQVNTQGRRYVNPFYVTENASDDAIQFANNFANTKPEMGNPTMYPLMIRQSEVLDTRKGIPQNLIDAAQKSNEELKIGSKGLPSWGPVNNYATAAKEGGIKALLLDERPNLNSIAVLDPSIIRSRFAAFDPMRRNEADILAGLLPASLLADPETRRKLDEELSLLYTK